MLLILHMVVVVLVVATGRVVTSGFTETVV